MDRVCVSKRPLVRVLLYLAENEKKHYEECEPEEREGHIWNDVKQLTEEVNHGGKRTD